MTTADRHHDSGRITLTNLVKEFAGRDGTTRAVDDIDLETQPGEFLIIKDYPRFWRFGERIVGNSSVYRFTLGAHDAAVLRREFGDLYAEEDLVSLERYQVICKLTVQGEVTRPFPAHTLPLAKTRTPHKDKVLRVSRERYARK